MSSSTHSTLNRRPRLRARAPQLLFGGLLTAGCCAAGSTGALHTQSNSKGDARYLLLEESRELRADGSKLRRTKKKVAAYSDYGVDHLGDPRVPHDATTEKLEVLRVDTTMRDGTVVKAKKNSITETTADVVAKAPAYSDLRETVITHVGMEVGCTNDLEYTIEEKANNRPMEGVVPLRQGFGTERLVVSLKAPGETRWACVGCKAQPQVKKQGAAVQLQWRDLDALNLQEVKGLPRPVAGEARVVYSTARTWEEVAAPLAARFIAAAAPSDTIRKQAEELAEGMVTPAERAMAMWRFVAAELTTIDRPLAEVRGYDPSAAADVLERSYGHVMDKAVLLAALLGAVEIPSRAVLVSRDHLLAEDVPALSQLTDVWLVADIAGDPRWLSPSHVVSGTGPARLEGRFALDLASPKAPTRIESTGGELNQSVVTLDLSLKECGKLAGEVEVTLLGTYNPFVSVSDKKSSDKVMGSALGATSAASFATDCDGCYRRIRELSPRLASFAFKAEARSESEGRHVEVTIPWVPSSQILAADVSRSQRETLTTLVSRGIETMTAKITVAKGLELRSKLPVDRIENRVGSLVTTNERKGDEITIRRTLRIHRRIVDSDTYEDLRALAMQIQRADRQTLLFTKKRP